jgi:hypothetical protein
MFMSERKLPAPITGEYRMATGGQIIEGPKGKVFTKFHGNGAFISEPKPGEKPNKAGYTPTQAVDLDALEKARVKGELVRRPMHFFPIEIVDFAQR